MTLYRHCDGPDCDAHQKLDTDMGDFWLHVEDRHQDKMTHFCNGDCLMKWAAQWSEPPEVVA